MKKYQIKPGDILISLVGTHGKISLVPDNVKNGIINPRLLKDTLDKSKALPEFMKILLGSKFIERQILRFSHGLTMGILNTEIIKQILFPLPSIQEQQKIASILSKVDDLVQKTDQVIEQTQRLKKGLMQRLLTKGIGHQRFKPVKLTFGKHEEIPEEWEVVRFGDVSKIKRGASPRPIADPNYFGIGRGWIRISDVTKSHKYLERTEDHLSELGKSRSVPVNQGDLQYPKVKNHRQGHIQEQYKLPLQILQPLDAHSYQKGLLQKLQLLTIL